MLNNLVESVKLREKLGNRRLIASNLAGLAAAAFYDGIPLGAARLAGAAEALLASIHARMEADVRPVYGRTLAEARAALGEEAFNAAWNAGRNMRPDEAIEYALKTVEGV